MPVYSSMGELNKALKKRAKAERKKNRQEQKQDRRSSRSDTAAAGSSAIVPSKMEKSKDEGPLKKGVADPDVVAACSHGDLASVRALLDSGAAGVNQQNQFGRTGLFKAASYGFVDVCALLLERKADLFLKDAKGYTAVDWARLSRQAETARLLENAMAVRLRDYRAEFEEEERRKALEWIWDRNAACSADVEAALLRNDLAGCVNVLEDCPPRADFDEAKRLNPARAGEIHCTDVMTRHGWTALTKAAAVGDVERAAKIMAAKVSERAS